MYCRKARFRGEHTASRHKGNQAKGSGNLTGLKWIGNYFDESDYYDVDDITALRFINGYLTDI